MNAETIMRAAENDGLRIALTDIGTVRCIGPKQVTERWAPQLRQHKAEIVAVLAAANDAELMTDEAAEFWRTLSARIAECDRLIHRVCDLRREPDEYRAEMLAIRKRMAPEKLDGDIAYLRGELDRCQRLNADTKGAD